MTVIHALERPVVKRNTRGRVDTTIGCVDTGRAEINIVVAGEEIDLSLAARLEDEEMALAAINALEQRQAHTYIALDAVHADGLVRLLQKAIAVRALSMADARRECVSGARRGRG